MKSKDIVILTFKIIGTMAFGAICIGLYFLFGLLLGADSINYGEYGYIGKIIHATVLAVAMIAFVFALYGKHGKTKRIIAGFVCAILIALFVPITNLTGDFCAKPYTTFSTENWNRTACISPNLLQYMLPGLEEKYNLVGMNISDVDRLLGLNNWGPSNYGNKYYHRIGSDHTFLVIEYDEKGIVTKVTTTNDSRLG